MEFNRFFKICLTSPDETSIIEIDSSTPGLGIAEGSMVLTEILCDRQLEFGACNSDKFEIQIYGLTEDVTGYSIEVYNEPTPGDIEYIFVGKIDSAKADKFNYYRDIVAYDALYWVRDVDVGNFWVNFWTTCPDATIKILRTALCQYVGLYTEDGVTCYNDNVRIRANKQTVPHPVDGNMFITQFMRPFEVVSGSSSGMFIIQSDGITPTDYGIYAPVITEIKFGVLLQMICELQACCPTVTRDGKITFVTLTRNQGTMMDNRFDVNKTTFEDYATDAPTGFAIYQTSDSLYQTVPTSASNSNPYAITGNLFLLEMTRDQVTSLLTPLVSVVQDMVYTPVSMSLIVSDLGIKLGRCLSDTWNNRSLFHFVLSQTLSGPQLVEQVIESPAKGKQLSSKTSSTKDSVTQSAQVSQLQKSAVEVVYDTRSAGGSALTGITKTQGLSDGRQIIYWLNYAAGSNATLELTFPDGTTSGPKPVYYSGATRLSTHYAAGNAIRMVYMENALVAGTDAGAGWWCDANYYSDSNYDIFGTALITDTAINAYSLCAITGTTGTIAKQSRLHQAGTYWKLNSFTQTSGTSQSKKATTLGYYPGKLFYNTSSTAYAAGATTSTLASSTSNIDLRYSVNGSTSAQIGVAGAPFFLVGTITNGLFYLKGSQATTGWWQCGVPVSSDSYVYWFVGIMSDKYRCRLADENWFYHFESGVFKKFIP